MAAAGIKPSSRRVICRNQWITPPSPVGLQTHSSQPCVHVFFCTPSAFPYCTALKKNKPTAQPHLNIFKEKSSYVKYQFITSTTLVSPRRRGVTLIRLGKASCLFPLTCCKSHSFGPCCCCKSDMKHQLGVEPRQDLKLIPALGRKKKCIQVVC